MTAVARMYHDHPAEVTATFRRYGAGLDELGRGLGWHEARLLLEVDAGDTMTPLGAALAGWSYRADVPTLAILMALGGKGAAQLMPWAKRKPEVTSEERDAALARLQADIRFGGDSQ